MLKNGWREIAPQNSSLSGEIGGVEVKIPQLFAVVI